MKNNKFSLFEVFGVEMEYMIVDKTTLKVLPIADKAIAAELGEVSDDVELGDMAWSNELVAHVVEIKTNGPAASMDNLDSKFHEQVTRINKILDQWNAMLLPTGAHPTMDPLKETVIWPHSYNEVYSLYNRIFDCKGHGWANLQSTHINLPFANDEEFAKLHAAIRVMLPIIPALTASTPILDGKLTGFEDSRLEVYRKNQQKIPSIAGKVIPEQVFSKDEYHQQIFEPIKNDIRPYDEEKILDHHFLNSRGAIARFDRGAVEIRIIDIQECPKADIALLYFIVESIKHLIDTVDLNQLKLLHENELSALFLKVIKTGKSTDVDDLNILKIFGFNSSVKVSEVIDSMFLKIKTNMPKVYAEVIEYIINNGNLSERIVNELKPNPSKDELHDVYNKLAVCLKENKLF